MWEKVCFELILGCDCICNPPNKRTKTTLSATDVLAPTTMKNAAKCDTSCELQNPVSHQNFERNLHFSREVCLLECLFIPTKPCIGFWDWQFNIIIKPITDVKTSKCLTIFFALFPVAPLRRHKGLIRRCDVKCKTCINTWFRLKRIRLFTILCTAKLWRFQSDRTSNQSRIPAEFKHITRRRKRN